MSEKLTLSELQLLIKDSLYLSLPGFYWVVAEISEIKENYAGHCYLELIEKHADDQNIRARVKAVIWNSRYGFLKSFFENITGESLKAGIKILVKAKIEYHEVYGLSLVITDIDPSFTLGEMALKRQQILKRLEEEGVLNMNKEISFPEVPQRIAIISSRNAAGYTDFMKHLTQNSYGYSFYTWLADTIMQGNETESGIIGALDRIALHIDVFDVVVIIRGGGSQTDLSWFDNYGIAYYITQFPLPVITGIGHEKDLTVTDIVANQSLKTPTAVADFLIECMIKTDEHLLDLSSEIADNARTVLDENKQKTDSFRMKLIPMAKIMISEIREELSGSIIDMINTGKGYILRAGLIPSNQKSRLGPAVKSFLTLNESEIARKKQDLVNASSNILHLSNNRISVSENSLKILDPVNVLKRGYTITSLNGQILKSVNQVKTDDMIDTHFPDGSVMSKVTFKEKENETGKKKEGTKD
jgi:exodeoxyribonuclease VII large subunit